MAKYNLDFEIEKDVDEIRRDGNVTVIAKYKNDNNLAVVKPSDRINLDNRLANCGCIIKNYCDLDCIIEYIEKKIMEEDYTYTFKKLGWDYYLNQKVIKLSKLETGQGQQKSKYIGEFRLGQKGDKKEFIQGVKDYIVGKPGLEIALLVGVCGLIAQELPDYDTNILINYYGKYSANKVYTMRIPLMLFGDPDKLDKPISKLSYSEKRERTENQIIPAIIEELQSPITSKNDGKQYKVLEETITNCCCPIILSTVESIVNKAASCNEGNIRAFEIPCECEEMAISKEHLYKLKMFMRNSYGVAGEEFAQWMLKQGIYEGKLEDELYDWRNKLEQIFKCEDRMINNMAVIMLAGDLMNRCFGFGINLNIIQNILTKSVNRVIGDEVQDKYFNKLVEYIGMNKEYFTNDRTMCFRDKHIGLFEVKNGNCDLWIEPKAFRYILLGKDPKEYLDSLTGKTAKIKENVKGAYEILNEWKLKGILQSGRESKGKKYYTSEKTLFNTQLNIYIIRLGKVSR